MASDLHKLTVGELEAATRALSRMSSMHAALAKRFEDQGDQEAAGQVRREDEKVANVLGVLLRAVRQREKEDREKAYVESGD
jgi:hypothetical protein